MNALLYSEIKGLCAIILTIIAINTILFNNSKKTKQVFFTHAAWAAVLGNVFDLLWKICTARYVAVPLLPAKVICFLYFISYDLFAYFVFLCFEAVARSDIFKVRRKMAAAAVPFFLSAVLLAVSVFNGCVFSIDNNVIYHRGSLFYVQQILVYGYAFAAIIRTVISMAKKQNYAYHDEMLGIVVYSIPALVCGIIQIFVPELPVFSVGVTVAFLCIYIRSLQTLILIDSLTGINNRRELLKRLDERAASLHRNERLYFLFIDIDSFKRINDVYGHTEGDKTLRLVASVLKKVCEETGGFCARYGGDEFVVVQIMKDNDDITRIRNKIYTLVKQASTAQNLPYSVSVSIGCSEYVKDAASIQDLISHADINMYRKKMSKKNAAVNKMPQED